MNWRKLFNFGNRWQFFGGVFSPSAIYNSYSTDKEKLDIILKNFALLKIVSLQCDLFSMGKFYVQDLNNGEYIEDDAFLNWIKNPNPFQNESQFLWSYMFNHMMGTGNIYTTSSVIENQNLRAYVLDNWKIDMPYGISSYDKLAESNGEVKRIFDKSFNYIYNDGSTKVIKFSDVISIKDLPATSDWFNSYSRIDALYKIITNIEDSLDSENINIRFSGKFIVSGTSDPENVNQMPLSNQEKEDIERKTNFGNPVTATKSMIDIKRYVDSVGNIGLSEIESTQFSRIATVFGVPEEIAKAFAEKGSTYENQEKAKGSYIDFVLEPKGKSLCNAFKNRFYPDRDVEILISWDHLSFMQVFEKEKAEIQERKANVLEKLLKLNVPLDEINYFIDTSFTSKDIKYDPKNYTRQSNSGNN